MNLIPQTPAATGNYYCTWAAQGPALGRKDLHPEKGLNNCAQGINEAFLFSERGLIASIDPEICGDLILVLDDGWDVPMKRSYENNNPFGNDAPQYGSMIPSIERFPSFPGTPVERLKGLSDKTKEMGMRGLGLWVSPQVWGDIPANPSAKQAEPYWRERFTWCHEADIKYIKVDWGARGGDADYRAMMTRVAREAAPGLLVEHSLNQGMLDTRMAHREEESGYEKKCRYIERMQYCSDFFRIYDVIGQFTDLTAMLRAGDAMRAVKNHDAAISTPSMEDSMYTAAALGGTFGAMRCHAFCGGDWSQSPFPMSEMKRAVMWSRIAPPFPLNATPYEVTDAYQTDDIDMPYGPVLQDCYLAIARNMPLPVVKPKLKGARSTLQVPYVICSHNPYTEATAVYALPRNLCGELFLPIRADVRIDGADEYAPVGIFGWYDRLTIDFGVDIRYKRVWAQDLCAKEAVEITDQVDLSGQELIIKGELIDKIGLTVRESTKEIPGMVLAMTEKYE